jgi:NAD(P)H-dependent flavin oxidoreductase YrpB (nitropropane dioxygenase family)
MAFDLHTPICDLLGCEHPVVLAGMGGVARSELVIAVTEAGGFGFLGMSRKKTAHSCRTSAVSCWPRPHFPR